MSALELPGVGAIQPDGNAYLVPNPVTIPQLRELAKDDRTSAMTVTSKDGIPTFRAVVTVHGRQATVTGELEVDE